MQRSDEMTATLIQITLKKYVCGQCWGHLTEITIKGKRYVVCARYHEHSGFVTASYAERTREQSREDKLEAMPVLKAAGIIEAATGGMTADEIIEEITVE